MRYYDRSDNITTIDKFAGMNLDEIYDWLEIEEAREHIRWEKSEKERLAKEREEDAKYCEVGDKNVVDPEVPVTIEDSIKINPEKIDTKGFVSKKDLDTFERFTALSYKGKIVYSSNEFREKVYRVFAEIDRLHPFRY